MYGHRVDASLGMGYVKRPHAITPDWIAATRFEVNVGDRRVAARAQLAPWYDPKKRTGASMSAARPFRKRSFPLGGTARRAKGAP